MSFSNAAPSSTAEASQPIPRCRAPDSTEAAAASSSFDGEFFGSAAIQRHGARRTDPDVGATGGTMGAFTDPTPFAHLRPSIRATAALASEGSLNAALHHTNDFDGESMNLTQHPTPVEGSHQVHMRGSNGSRLHVRDGSSGIPFVGGADDGSGHCPHAWRPLSPTGYVRLDSGVLGGGQQHIHGKSGTSMAAHQWNALCHKGMSCEWSISNPPTSVGAVVPHSGPSLPLTQREVLPPPAASAVGGGVRVKCTSLSGPNAPQLHNKEGKALSTLPSASHHGGGTPCSITSPLLANTTALLYSSMGGTHAPSPSRSGRYAPLPPPHPYGTSQSNIRRTSGSFGHGLDEETMEHSGQAISQPQQQSSTKTPFYSHHTTPVEERLVLEVGLGGGKRRGHGRVTSTASTASNGSTGALFVLSPTFSEFHRIAFLGQGRGEGAHNTSSCDDPLFNKSCGGAMREGRWDAGMSTAEAYQLYLSLPVVFGEELSATQRYRQRYSIRKAAVVASRSANGMVSYHFTDASDDDVCEALSVLPAAPPCTPTTSYPLHGAPITTLLLDQPTWLPNDLSSPDDYAREMRRGGDTTQKGNCRKLHKCPGGSGSSSFSDGTSITSRGALLASPQGLGSVAAYDGAWLEASSPKMMSGLNESAAWNSLGCSNGSQVIVDGGGYGGAASRHQPRRSHHLHVPPALFMLSPPNRPSLQIGGSSSHQCPYAGGHRRSILVMSPLSPYGNEDAHASKAVQGDGSKVGGWHYDDDGCGAAMRRRLLMEHISPDGSFMLQSGSGGDGARPRWSAMPPLCLSGGDVDNVCIHIDVGNDYHERLERLTSPIPTDTTITTTTVVNISNSSIASAYAALYLLAPKDAPLSPCPMVMPYSSQHHDHMSADGNIYSPPPLSAGSVPSPSPSAADTNSSNAHADGRGHFHTPLSTMTVPSGAYSGIGLPRTLGGLVQGVAGGFMLSPTSAEGDHPSLVPHQHHRSNSRSIPTTAALPSAPTTAHRDPHATMGPNNRGLEMKRVPSMMSYQQHWSPASGTAGGGENMNGVSVVSTATYSAPSLEYVAGTLDVDPFAATANNIDYHSMGGGSPLDLQHTEPPFN